jgi:hypothetical protein
MKRGTLPLVGLLTRTKIEMEVDLCKLFTNGLILKLERRKERVVSLRNRPLCRRVAPRTR